MSYSVWPVVLTGVGLAGVTGIALWRIKSRKPLLTPEKRQQFDHAMNHLLDVTKIRDLAAKFHGEGLIEQAEILEKRAALREAPSEIKEARRKVYRDALKSTNPQAVRKIADAFEKQGAMGAANSLRDYANKLANHHDSEAA